MALSSTPVLKLRCPERLPLLGLRTLVLFSALIPLPSHGFCVLSLGKMWLFEPGKGSRRTTFCKQETGGIIFH